MLALAGQPGPLDHDALLSLRPAEEGAERSQVAVDRQLACAAGAPTGAQLGHEPGGEVG
jgi:hypothetical protein